MVSRSPTEAALIEKESLLKELISSSAKHFSASKAI